MKGVVIRRDLLPQVLAAVGELTKREVLVGVPAAENSRPGDPLGNAALAYIHENGAPEANIPARPFLGPGIENARDSITAYLEAGARAALDGAPARVERALHAAGLTAQTAVQRKMDTGPFAPLQPATLAARRARGRTGTKPLLDTGELRRAITYVLRVR